MVIEKDPDCRSLNKMRWPGCDVVADIARVTKGLTGVGGSPCQGILRLNADRVHLQDPRSKFFYKYVEVLGWIEDVAREMRVWCVMMVENAVGDDEGIKEMSQQLGCRPLYMCASGMSWARRPRLGWSNVGIDDHPSYQLNHHECYDVLEFNEELEPLNSVCDTGCMVAHLHLSS